MEKNNELSKRNIKIQDLVYMSLMSALTLLAASFITIPSYNGVIHIGDSIVFISVVVLGRKKGAISSALGMFLFDILHGYTYWAPFTLIIKGIMALIAGYLWEKGESKSIIQGVLAFSMSGLFMILAYFLSGALIKLLFSGKAITFTQALIVSSYDIFGNVLQVVVGIIIAMPIIKGIEAYRKS
ncbi:ECF transporter S component [Clostridium amazonitimonense]|uniref:ECF transporter S component n=1 Tax=Clostridium amazonitimonense TaxID=1499689 RepID=UPI000509FAAD|nr:ECF transporter S component [Clostridium amazonitimonense]